MDKMIVLMAILFLTGIGITAFNVFLIDCFDTSPTEDDRCRGGHDF